MLPEFILTLSCRCQRGIVHRVAGLLAEPGGNIVASAQFGDLDAGRFFMRVHFVIDAGGAGSAGNATSLRAALAVLGEDLQMDWKLHDAHAKPRVLIMVSKIGHCLNDLLFRYKSGLLPVEICGVVSNHMDFYQLAASYNIPFHHLPLATGASEEAKLAQEARITELLDLHRIE